MSKFVEYSHNNSGGERWLTRDQWVALEKAGWKVLWVWLEFDWKDHNWHFDDGGLPVLTPNGKPVGSAVGADWAHHAFKPNATTREEAIAEWEQITGADHQERGCSCCGMPHSFELYEIQEGVEA